MKKIRGVLLLVLLAIAASQCACVADFGGDSNTDCVVYGGDPTSQQSLLPLANTGFNLGYSDAQMNPIWVAYRVCGISNPIAHPRPSFRVDDRTGAKVSPDDYTNTGFDRGHMAPNATMDYCYDRDGQLDSFLMSNVCPQTPALNRGVWASLEEYVRDCGNALEEVWVITGPIFDGVQATLPAGVEIPDAFYKILIDETCNGIRVLAFRIPQYVASGTSPEDWLTSVDAIEQETGLNFLPGLADTIEIPLEQTTAAGLWDVSSSPVGSSHVTGATSSAMGCEECLSRLNAASRSAFDRVYGIGEVLSTRLVAAKPFVLSYCSGQSAIENLLQQIYQIGPVRSHDIVEYFCGDLF